MDLTASEISALADKYANARLERLAQSKILAQFEAVESDLKGRLIQVMVETETSATGGAFIVKCTPHDTPTPEDWPEIHQFVKDNDALDLLQKRLHQGACKERWDDDIEIPGVSHFTVHKLTVGKGTL